MTRPGPGGATAATLAAAVAGAGLVLAFPPFGFWPLALGAPAVLCAIAVETRRSAGAAAAAGLGFGIAFFGGTTYWVVPVMARYGGLPLPSAILVLAALLAYLAAFPLLFALTLRRAAGRLGPGRALALAPFLWAALELVRNHALSGFPWVRLGSSLQASLPLLQVAAVVGVYGASAVLAAGGAALAAPFVLPPGCGWRIRAAPPLAAAVALAVLGGWGGLRMRGLEAGGAGGMRVACVQGNIPQDRKWDRREAGRILDRHARLTEEAAAAGAALVVWPESSLPFALRASPEFGDWVRRLTARTGVPLLLGSLDYRGDAVYNAAFLLDAEGSITGRYDKVHLVPFGEYVPFAWVLRLLPRLVEQVGAMRPGADPAPLAAVPPAPGIPPLGVHICYEIVFPELPRQAVRRGAELLVTITNDAWFGRSTAPYQHFGEAVVRAVETGRWVVRAANTGISGIVSPSGRVTAHSRLDEAVVIQGEVEPRRGTTFYTRTGDAFAWGCAIITLFTLAAPQRRCSPPRGLAGTPRPPARPGPRRGRHPT